MPSLGSPFNHDPGQPLAQKARVSPLAATDPLNVTRPNPLQASSISWDFHACLVQAFSFGTRMHRLRTIGRLRAGGSGFNPLTLFAAGEQGAWYDPSDLSTQFQDLAGTAPVTAATQPVGLVLDKRLGLQRGPQLAPTISSANYSVFNSDATHVVTFNDVAGTFRYQSDTTSPALTLQTTAVLTIGKWYEFTVVVSAFTSGAIKSDTLIGNPILGSGVGTFRAIGQAQSTVVAITRSTSNVDLTVSSVTARELPGNHLVQATTTSRPTLQQDAGGYWYWNLDGVDDSWGTAATMDLSGTDKVSVFAGVYKGQDAATAIMFELTADTNVNNGGMFFVVPNTGSGQSSAFVARGTVIPASGATGPAWPTVTSRVASMSADIAGALETMRLNAVAGASSAQSMGTGNLANATLFVGRRNNASLPFTGRLYQLVLRGALSSAAQITAAERFVGSKTGIVL